MTKQHRINPSSDMHAEAGGVIAMRASLRDRLQGTRTRPCRGSCLEKMAERATAISPARLDLLGLLLATTVSSIRYQGATPTSVWVDEAMQRAYDYTKLAGALERHPAEPGEQAVARAIAGVYGQLDAIIDKGPLGCSAPLRTAIRSLVELFAPMIADMRLCMTIERLALPAEKRRALVLVACKLVIEALENAANGYRSRTLTVILTQDTSSSARLRVARTVFGPSAAGNHMLSKLVINLAAVLEGRPIIVAADQAVATEIVFPHARPSVAGS